MWHLKIIKKNYFGNNLTQLYFLKSDKLLYLSSQLVSDYLQALLGLLD